MMQVIFKAKDDRDGVSKSKRIIHFQLLGVNTHIVQIKERPEVLLLVMNWIVKDFHSAASITRTGPNQSQVMMVLLYLSAYIRQPDCVNCFNIWAAGWRFSPIEVIYIFPLHAHLSKPEYQRTVIIHYCIQADCRSLSCPVIIGMDIKKWVSFRLPFISN